jgi:hypothetical protein
VSYDPPRPSVYTPFLRRFTDEPARDLSETIALYDEVRRAHANSVSVREGIRAMYPGPTLRSSRHQFHRLSRRCSTIARAMRSRSSSENSRRMPRTRAFIRPSAISKRK